MEWLTFRLKDDFVDGYRNRPVPWGFAAGGGNYLGELTFLTKYSRVKSDGTKETWVDCCRRVIEGVFTILKNHCETNRTPWYGNQAHKNANEMFDLLFNMKWTPPGRGLWMMGSEFVAEEGSASLLNCAFISTESLGLRNPTAPFTRLMEMSMLGVGVGFDTAGVGALDIMAPEGSPFYYTIPDSREGWCDSTGMLLQSFFLPRQHPVVFDYSEIRPAGAPIKRFGGVAAGAGPLQSLHETLQRLLTSRNGQSITSTDIVDVMNLIGRCVVAGNIRRSAEIALGQPDDKEFLNLKNARVNPERMGVAGWKEDGSPIWAEGGGWGFTSNNSILAQVGGDYEHIIDLISNNGEPGLYYRDLARAYGRLNDPRNDKDAQVMGVNPCVGAETMVMTTEGPRRAIDLLHRPFWAVVNGKAYHSRTGMFPTRTADLYRLLTVEGYSVLLTENHAVRTVDGRMVPAEDLVPGDRLEINNHRSVGGWSGRGSDEDGYLLGSFVGDGGWEGHAAVIKIWQSDEGSGGVREALHRAAMTIHHRSDWQGWRDHSRGYESMSLPTSYLAAWGISRRWKTSELLENTSSAFHSGFLRGLFDTDGHIEGWQETHDKGASIRLSQTDCARLELVQRMLLRLGIKSRIHTDHSECTTTIQDQTYQTQPCWRLIVSSNDLPVFAERIGFSHTIKAEKLAKLIARTRFYAKPFIATVASFEYVRTDIVYDCTVDDLHLFDANGLVVSNCGEQSLESMELCTLVETFPARCRDLADFFRVIKYAYLYGKVVTLLPTHWADSNVVMTRNRRIGCSVSGVVQFAERHGWTELRHWLDQGYAEVQRRDDQYSKWLGIRESIKTTSVKPSGTVSLLTGQTPGVHWPEDSIYIRRQRFRVNDPIIGVFTEAGYPVEPDVQDPAHTVVVEFPVQGPGVRSVRDVSIWEKVHLAMVLQGHWADNCVSATFTFRPEERDQIGPVIRASDGKLKSMSFLEMTPRGSYAQMPYERIDPEEYERRATKVCRIDYTSVYQNGVEPEGEKGCSNDVCEIPR